jgi:hypothetical protein
MKMVVLVFVVALTAPTGCAPASSDRATVSPATTLDYPDMTSFGAVDPNDYRVNYPYMNGVVFRTANGMSCSYNAMNSLNDPHVTVVSCTGPRPDNGPGVWEVRAATDKAATVDQEPLPLNPTYQDSTGKILPARHTLAYKGFQCGTDDSGTACRTGDHGFVLTATETKLC